MPPLCAPPDPPAHEVSVVAGYQAQAWLESVGTSNRQAVGLGGWLRVDPGVEVGVGARRLFGATLAPATGWEGWLGGRLGPRIGCWSPAAGIELGLTGALQQNFAAIEKSFFYEEFVANGTRDVVYGAFTVSPLRFRVGPIIAEVASLSFGSSLPSWGRAVRVELTPLEAGWVF
jgi:hypothetical protein